MVNISGTRVGRNPVYSKTGIREDGSLLNTTAPWGTYAKDFYREENTHSDYISHFPISALNHPTKVI